MGRNRLSREQYIGRAIAVHGRMYDYDDLVYSGMVKPVTVVCKEHGPFTLRADTHVNSRKGCPRCAPTRGCMVYVAEAVGGVKVGVTSHRRAEDRLVLDFYEDEFTVLMDCKFNVPEEAQFVEGAVKRKFSDFSMALVKRNGFVVKHEGFRLDKADEIMQYIENLEKAI